jgi:hypothetical protein
MTSKELSIVAVAVVLGAGCLGAPALPEPGPAAGFERGPDTPRPAFDFSTAIVQNHDHEDRSLHTAAFDMELVGFTDMISAARPGTLPGGYFELAIAGTWAFVSNMGPDRGFSIVDIADPARMRHVADFYTDEFMSGPAGAGSYWDVSVFPDGDLVVLSAQALTSAPLTAERVSWQGGGMFLVDTSNKADPRLESFTAVADADALIKVGVHNANPFEVDGVWYVAATTANGKTYIYELVGERPSRTLNLVSTIIGMHDTAVQVHPILGRPILYTATNGVYTWDMSDPRNPVQLGFVANGEALASYHETNPSDVLIDGRHYTVAGGESLEGNPTMFTILDTTDPETIEIVGTWRLPGNLQGPGAFYTFSGHNFDVDHGRLIIGHYHAGVWIVDISNETNARDPFPLGFYQPHEDAVYVPRTTKGVDNPSVWRATMHEDGFIYTTDTNSGLYALRYTGPPSPLAGAPTYPTNIR